MMDKNQEQNAANKKQAVRTTKRNQKKVIGAYRHKKWKTCTTAAYVFFNIFEAMNGMQDSQQHEKLRKQPWLDLYGNLPTPVKIAIGASCAQLGYNFHITKHGDIPPTTHYGLQSIEMKTKVSRDACNKSRGRGADKKEDNEVMHCIC
jgi:hypothetical protein